MTMKKIASILNAIDDAVMSFSLKDEVFIYISLSTEKIYGIPIEEFKTLHGIVPVCSNCKKIRTDDGYWQKVEVYVCDHTEAEYSHGICPERTKKLYPELSDAPDDLD